MSILTNTKLEKSSNPLLIPTAYQRLVVSKTVNRPGVHILTDVSWLEPVLALHKQVRDEMPRSQSHYLLPKTADYFRNLLQGKSGILLGVLAKDHLVGSMAIVHAHSFAAAKAEERLTCPDPDGTLGQLFGEGTVAVAQSLCVWNNYLGRGYSRALIDAAVHWVSQQKYNHLFAQVAAQNTLSWLRFLDHDFAIVSTWKSGHRRFLLRWFPPEEKAGLLRKASSADRHSYKKDYAQMPAALSELSLKLKRGRIVLLNNNSEKTKDLPFVFSKLPYDFDEDF